MTQSVSARADFCATENLSSNPSVSKSIFRLLLLLSVHLCPKNEALRRGKICAMSLQVC